MPNWSDEDGRSWRCPPEAPYYEQVEIPHPPFPQKGCGCACCKHAKTKGNKFMIKVVNKYFTSQGVYIGRGSPLGNPFPIGPGMTREHVIALFRTWMIEQIQQNNPTVVNELYRLLDIAKKGDLYLKCFCSPKACHGDVIKAFLEAQLRRS